MIALTLEIAISASHPPYAYACTSLAPFGYADLALPLSFPFFNKTSGCPNLHIPWLALFIFGNLLHVCLIL
jgi:hypothetical protein